MPPDETGFVMKTISALFEIWAAIEGHWLRPQSDALLDEEIDLIARDVLSRATGEVPIFVTQAVLRCLTNMAQHRHPPAKLVASIDLVIDILELADMTCLSYAFSFLGCLTRVPGALDRMLLRPILFVLAVTWMDPSRDSDMCSVYFVDSIISVSNEATIMLVDSGLIEPIRPLTRHPWANHALPIIYLFERICSVPELLNEVLACNIIQESIRTIVDTRQLRSVRDAFANILREVCKHDLTLATATKQLKFIEAFKFALDGNVSDAVLENVLRFGSALGALASTDSDPTDTGSSTNPYAEYLSAAYRAEGKEDVVERIQNALRAPAL